MKKEILHLLSIIMLLGLMITAQGAAIDGYGGYISDDIFDQGDEVRFSGTIHNFSPSDIFVVSMNVSFREDITETRTQQAEIFNLSRYYDGTNRQRLSPNDTNSDVMQREVDFDPGTYKVNIFFDYATDQELTQLNQSYSLVNKTVTISGTTQALRIAQVLGYALVGLTAVIIGLLVYNRFKK